MHANPLQIGQVFQNLIGNAFKFRGDRPAVLHISAFRKTNEWVVSVADQGIGIAPQHTREEYAGNGVGLTLCQGITFFFSLPDRVV